jgi:hypothetical protein
VVLRVFSQLKSHTLSDPTQDQKGWQRGAGLFGSALGDIGNRMQGMPTNMLGNFMAQQRARSGAGKVTSLLDEARSLPTTPIANPPSTMVTSAQGTPLSSEPSLGNLLAQAFVLQAHGIDASPFFNRAARNREGPATVHGRGVPS